MTRLVDTDVAVEIIRARDPDVVARARRHPAFAYSAITAFELERGAMRSGHAQVIRTTQDFLATVEMVVFDREAASHAADIRVDLERLGTPIGAYDLLIAGQARSRGLVLATRNLREFQRVDGLRVERW